MLLGSGHKRSRNIGLEQTQRAAASTANQVYGITPSSRVLNEQRSWLYSYDCSRPSR
jgi:hypothetical protein